VDLLGQRGPGHWVNIWSPEGQIATASPSQRPPLSSGGCSPSSVQTQLSPPHWKRCFISRHSKLVTYTFTEYRTHTQCMYFCGSVPLYGDAFGEPKVREENSNTGQLRHWAGFHSRHWTCLEDFNHGAAGPQSLLPPHKNQGAWRGAEEQRPTYHTSIFQSILTGWVLSEVFFILFGLLY